MLSKQWRLLSLALLAIIGIVAGAVFAAGHGDTEVRVSAYRHDDGRVEVGLQQRAADGSWGERSLAQNRFLRPGVTGEWLHSSPIPVHVAHDDDDDAMSDDIMSEPVAPPEPPPATALHCIVHHGSDNDQFWLAFNGFAQGGAAGLGVANVEIHSEPDIADQAAAITDCVDRGAVSIASTIPDLDGLQAALIGARSSGAILITFNSGADVAGLVGSTVHYGLDDNGAGQLAGREFNNAGATGTILCVLHEPVNIGLEDRCDGLASTYNGEVERLQLPEDGLTNPFSAGTAIAGGIMAHEAAGVVVLNGALAPLATETVSRSGSDALVGVIGASIAAPFLVDDGALLFAIDDGSQVQATHVTLAIKNVDANPAARALLALSASQAQGTTLLLMRPLVLNQDYISNLPDDWRAQSCALVNQLAPQLASAFCDQ